MGEFEVFERDGAADGSVASGSGPASPRGPVPISAAGAASGLAGRLDDALSEVTSSVVLPEWRVRARKELTRERVVQEVESDSIEAARVESLHGLMRQRARLYAQHLRLVAVFFREDPEVEGLLEDADLTALKIATGLRCSYLQATSQVHDAYRAVEWMPLTFEYLRRGDLPEAWHRSLLRRVRRLSEEQVRQVDARIAEVELPSISPVTFDKQVSVAVALATAGTLSAPPSSSRDVEVVGVDPEVGTASLLVTGPILEITGLAHRLDLAARTVQKTQRAMLEDGTEGPIPFDLDDSLRENGRAASLRALRYAILTHSILDIDPVQETRTPFKLLVTVPVTTLLGMDDSPAMLEGMTPIPAELARDLAGKETTWQRILTDPITGAHLPVDATTYQPSAQMRLQLRLRHPVCAAPGCTRSTVLAAEDDHIIEYDHDHPARGGPTSLWNLHRLCWQHHQLKTAGLIDPDRDPRDDPAREDRTTPAGPLETTWKIGPLRARTREHTDLLTPETVKTLDQAWTLHQRTRRVQQALANQDRTRPSPDTRRVTPPGATPEYPDPPY